MSIVDKLKRKTAAAKDFFSTDVWHVETVSLPGPLRAVAVSYRYLRLVITEFIQKNTFMTASALSYATVLGILPFLVVLVALSKGFLESSIEENAPKVIDALIANAAPVFDELPDEGVGLRIRQTLKSYVNTQLLPTVVKLDMSQFGVYGALTLIVIAISLMRTIETSFNDIWGVDDRRSIWSLFRRYWLAMALFPASVLTLLWLNGFGVFKHLVELRESVGIVRIFWDQLGSCVAVWVVFTLVYKFVPSTTVRIVPALVGGFIGGFLWQLNNLLAFTYVSKAINVHYLYGSIGIVPIFLLGLYTGWLILLFGAHVAFVAQHYELLKTKMMGYEPTPALQQVTAVACATLIARRFGEGGGQFTLDELSHLVRLPKIFVGQALAPLITRKILITCGDGEQYALGLPPEKVRLGDLLSCVIGLDAERKLGVARTPQLAKAAEFCDAYRTCPPETVNLTLTDMSRRL